MDHAESMRALRSSVAISRMDQIAHVRVTGDSAYAALDRVVTADLRLRDGQMIHSLLLEEDGSVFADLEMGCEEEAFFLIADGPNPELLCAYLRRQWRPGEDVHIEDRSASHALVAIDGPYAWELLAALAGPDVIGLPYLTFFHYPGGTCFRAGKTGEFGYGILVPREDLDRLWDALLRAGGELDVAVASQEALDQCALENGFFNARREGREPVTPLELQLQWRLSGRKAFLGSSAIEARRLTGIAERLTYLVAPSQPSAGAPVHLEGRQVGRVVQSGFSRERNEWVVQALIEVAWAHPWIDLFRVGPEGIPSRSVIPPLLNNRSLFVSPQIHSYRTRHEFTFPSLVRPG